MKIDLSPLEASGVTQTEFASILFVTRVTVNRWAQGGMPNPYLHKAATEKLQALQAAVDQGLLPGKLAELTPSKYNLDDRKAIIRDALEQVSVDA